MSTQELENISLNVSINPLIFKNILCSVLLMLELESEECFLN